VDSSSDRGGWGVGFIAGCLVGFVVAAGLGSLGVVVLSKREQRRTHVSWNLVPVVLAAQDLPEGAVISLDAIAEKAIPEQFVTASVVRPDRASEMLGVKLLAPLMAGDPIRWRDLATSIDSAECARICSWVGPKKQTSGD
jgi:Flp pilus assembly protein CpaB